MKTSLSRLPQYAKDDLKQIVKLVVDKLPRTEMIILYGSYARGDFVEFDERFEFGILTSFMSDYDILVITSETDAKQAGRILETVDNLYYKRPEHQVPIQFINDDIGKFNSDLAARRYFYTDIKKEGILLYNSGNFKLERARKLNYKEIYTQAKEYYEKKTKRSEDFFFLAESAYASGRYVIASFNLHQACENLFYAIRLVFTLKNSKQHNLYKLLGSTHKYSPELRNIFSSSSDKEKRLFELLKVAYVEARYNLDFDISKEDIEALMSKVKKFFVLTEKICKARLETYLMRIKKKG